MARSRLSSEAISAPIFKRISSLLDSSAAGTPWEDIYYDSLCLQPFTISETPFGSIGSASIAIRKSHQTALPHRSSNERREQWMRIERTRFQFGVELHSDEPGMIWDLHDLRQSSVRRPAGDDQTVLAEWLCVLRVYLIAMAMTFGDLRRAIGFGHATAW